MKEYTGQTVKIMICAACNNKCKHCYIPYEGNIDSEELYTLVTTLSNKYEVILNGTEPLMNPDYLKSLKLIKQKLILTNGLVFANNLAYLDQIKAETYIQQICVSYQFELQELFGSVSLSYLDKLFPQIRARGFDLELMCTISATNFDKVLAYCEKAVALKANIIYFIEYMNQGQAVNLDENLILSEAQKEKFFELVNEARKIYDINTLKVTRSGNFGPDNNALKNNFRCDALSNMVIITPDYKVYPCNFMIDYQNEIGYYQEGKIMIKEDLASDCTQCLRLRK
ncbi:MAG TPA: hypothetical protein PK737_01960 [Bacilli bacterium]|nr:hypothetical protein [Bacilli bacterium]